MFLPLHDSLLVTTRIQAKHTKLGFTEQKFEGMLYVCKTKTAYYISSGDTTIIHRFLY